MKQAPTFRQFLFAIALIIIGIILLLRFAARKLKAEDPSPAPPPACQAVIVVIPAKHKIPAMLGADITGTIPATIKISSADKEIYCCKTASKGESGAVYHMRVGIRVLSNCPNDSVYVSKCFNSAGEVVWQRSYKLHDGVVSALPE